MQTTEDNTKAGARGTSASSADGHCVREWRQPWCWSVYGSVVHPHGGGEPVMGIFICNLAW